VQTEIREVSAKWSKATFDAERPIVVVADENNDEADEGYKFLCHFLKNKLPFDKRLVHFEQFYKHKGK
jgi:hypothetical protein